MRSSDRPIAVTCGAACTAACAWTSGWQRLGFKTFGSQFGLLWQKRIVVYGVLYTPSWSVVAKEPVIANDYLPKVYAAAKKGVYSGNLADRMIKDFGDLGMGQSCEWDAVFPDGDIYKSGRGGQALYISPQTDTVVVYFSASYESSLWVHAYARAIVQKFRAK